MRHFLDEDFSLEYLKIPLSIHSEEYYVNMMLAWYFATALAKQWEHVVVLLENGTLDKWVHNKTIQKARYKYKSLKSLCALRCPARARRRGCWPACRRWGWCWAPRSGRGPRRSSSTADGGARLGRWGWRSWSSGTGPPPDWCGPPRPTAGAWTRLSS